MEPEFFAGDDIDFALASIRLSRMQPGPTAYEGHIVLVALESQAGVRLAENSCIQNECLVGEISEPKLTHEFV